MMMGLESHSFGDCNMDLSREDMENLLLDDPAPSDDSSYISATSSIQQPSRPLSYSLVSSPADHDPLLAPKVDRITDLLEIGLPSHTDSEDERDGAGDFSTSYEKSTFPSSSDYVNISVTNPQKEQEISNSLVPGGNSYFTYLITTRTNVSTFNGTVFSVRRRFRDIVTLSERLAESFRGFFIPPRPDKNMMESQVMQTQEFVEQRRVSLEKYLQRLAAHPTIRNSDELRVFLQVPGKLPLPTSSDVATRILDGASKLPKQLFGDGVRLSPQEVTQPAKGGRDLLRLFKELKQSVANDWGGSKAPLIEEEKDFLEKKERMHDLEEQLSSASKQAESLVKAQQDMGETMGELGLAFIKLTKFENEGAILGAQKQRAADMKNMATSAVKASRLYRELNAQTVKHLDVLHAYLGLMLSVQTAFADRSSALLTMQTLTTELSRLHSRAEKLELASSKVFGGDKSRIRKIEELKDSIKITEDAKHIATKEYERIKENNRTELQRLENERHNDFLSMLKGFVHNQIGYSEKIAQVWSKVAENTSGCTVANSHA